jgi:hypothetical protein
MTSDKLIADDLPPKNSTSLVLIFLFIGILTVALLWLWIFASGTDEYIRDWYTRNQRRTTQANDGERNSADSAGQHWIALQHPQPASTRRTSDISLAAPGYEESLDAPGVPYDVKLVLRDGQLYVVGDERPPSYRRSSS